MSTWLTVAPARRRTHAEIIEELQASAAASRGVERLSAPGAPSLLAGLDASIHLAGAVVTAAAPPHNGVAPGGARAGGESAASHSYAPRRGRPERSEGEGVQRHDHVQGWSNSGSPAS